jgi:hypothetical protein
VAASNQPMGRYAMELIKAYKKASARSNRAGQAKYQ